MANYSREMRMDIDLRKKRKIEKTMEFAERMRKVYKKAKVVLIRAQEEMKRQVNRERKEVEEWKKSNKMMLSTKDLVFKERPAKKLVD